jgi:hypothetical protein
MTNVDSYARWSPNIQLDPEKSTIKVNVPHITEKPNPGRGLARKLLIPHRIAKYGQLLYAMGLLPSEICGIEATFQERTVASSGNGAQMGKSMSWRERIHPSVLHGYMQNNMRAVATNFLAEMDENEATTDVHELPSTIRLNRTGVDYYAFEHLERDPIAYGIAGMYGSMLQFTRKETVKVSQPLHVDARVYPVELSNDEPCPFVYNISRENENDNLFPSKMDIYFCRGLGMTPIFELGGPDDEKHDGEDEDEEEYVDFVLIGNEAHEITKRYLLGQLEPMAFASTPDEARTTIQKTRQKPEASIVSDLCFARSALKYETYLADILPVTLINANPISLLESASIVYSLFNWSAEVDSAVLGKDKTDGRWMENTKERENCRALKFFIQELQLSPWHRSHCLMWLFHHVGSGKNPFPLGATCQVGEKGSLGGRLVSYLPLLNPVYKGYMDASKLSPIAHELDGDVEDQPKKRDPTRRKSQNRSRVKAAAITAPTETQPVPSSTATIASPSAAAAAPCVITGGVSAYTGNKSKKKKYTNLSRTKQSQLIGNTDRDSRRVTVNKLNSILASIIRQLIPGVVVDEQKVDEKINERWEKVWCIQKVASSHVVMRLAEGSEIRRFRRVEHMSVESTSSFVKREDYASRLIAEAHPAFKYFRRYAMQSYRVLSETARTLQDVVSIAKNGKQAAVEDQELDEFADLISHSIFNSATSSEHKESKGTEDINTWLRNHETALRAHNQRKAWFERQHKYKQKRDVLVEKKILLRYHLYDPLKGTMSNSVQTIQARYDTRVQVLKNADPVDMDVVEEEEEVIIEETDGVEYDG